MKRFQILILLLFCFINFTSATNLPYLKRKLIFNHSRVEQGFKILSLNTWGLPIPLHKSNNSKRFEKICTTIEKSDAQIICLQETFSKKFRSHLLKKFESKIFASDKIKSSRFSLARFDKHGGLVTMSSFKIIDETFVNFPINDNYNLFERIGKKGFLISLMIVNQDTIAVLNTHLYSGSNANADKIRKSQIEFIKNYIETNQFLKSCPMFFAGDFNFDPKGKELDKANTSTIYTKALKDLNLEDSFKENDIFNTYDHTKNNYSKKNEPCAKLDYIFKNIAAKKYNFTCAKIKFTGSEVVSDHMGIEAEISLSEYPRNNNLISINFN